MRLHSRASSHFYVPLKSRILLAAQANAPVDLLGLVCDVAKLMLHDLFGHERFFQANTV